MEKLHGLVTQCWARWRGWFSSRSVPCSSYNSMGELLLKGFENSFVLDDTSSVGSPSSRTCTNVQWNRSAGLILQPQYPRMSIKKTFFLTDVAVNWLLTSPRSLGQQDGLAWDREKLPKWFPQQRGTHGQPVPHRQSDSNMLLQTST